MPYNRPPTALSPSRKYWQDASRTPREGETPAQALLRQLYESLELPGKLADYHMAIQWCQRQLWEKRIDEPWVIGAIEELCLLDLRIVTQYPGFLEHWPGASGATQVYEPVSAFGTLLSIYEQRGNILEALDIAHQTVEFFGEDNYGYGRRLKSIEQRLRSLEAEDAGA